MKKIKREIIELIDSSILEIISAYVELKKTGSLYKGFSPFNSERTPSFVVAPSKGIWKDFSSGKGGKSAIKFIKEIEGLGFVDAVKKGAQILGVELEYEDDDDEYLFKEAIESLQYFFVENLKKHKNALDYLKSRGLTDGSIKKWGLGYAPSFKEMINWFNSSSYQKELLKLKIFYKKNGEEVSTKFYNRVMFPIHNHYGDIVGFSGRDITGKAKAKYINSNDSEIFHKGKILYGLNFVPKKHTKIILVEGQLDVILAHQYGIKIAVASQGTAFTQYQFNLIKDKKILICYDGDRAGINAAGKAAEIMLKNGKIPKVTILPDGKDVADILTTEGREKFLLYISRNVDAITFIIDLLIKEKNLEKQALMLKEIKSKLNIFPIGIQEAFNERLIAIAKSIETEVKKKIQINPEEGMLVKYIIEHDLIDEYVEPFKECFSVPINYQKVKHLPDLDEDEFLNLWADFEIICYKKKIKQIKESDLPFKEKKEKIKELERSIDAAKLIRGI